MKNKNRTSYYEYFMILYCYSMVQSYKDLTDFWNQLLQILIIKRTFKGIRILIYYSMLSINYLMLFKTCPNQ